MSEHEHMTWAWRVDSLYAGHAETEGRVNNVSLDVRVGERIALMGVDDAGRALLLRVLAGLRPHRSGQVSILGHELDRLPYYADWDQILPHNFRRKIGVCLEVEGLLSNVSVREGLEMLFRFKYGDHTQKLRDAATKAVQNICHDFGLGDSMAKRPYLLTSAERRIAGLARAFLSKPRLVLLENPSQNIGDSSRDRLWKALEFIVAQERTLLISTDDWAVASTFCDRWLVMEEGRLVFDGAPKEFIRLGHPMVEQFKHMASIQRSYQKLLEEAA
jgi:ABC-type multidrug transport system ATPase subunit